MTGDKSYLEYDTAYDCQPGSRRRPCGRSDRLFRLYEILLSRFRKRCEAAADRAEAVWRERGEAIVGEYLRDPDRFGKIAEVLGETPVRGLISTSAPKQGLGERIGKGIVGAVTFTRETDLGHYYFVAADDGLHLLGFDGERCFLNEVYAAGEIRRARLEPRTFSFDYKGGTVRMEVPNGGLAEGYPGSAFTNTTRSRRAATGRPTISSANTSPASRPATSLTGRRRAPCPGSRD